MSNGLNTREQILDAARRLFGERGFEDVSVRDVTQAAGVNLASVSYYFGGKEGLIQEAVKRCMNPINEYRMELLDRQIAEHGCVENVPLRKVMEAFMRPLVMPEECGVHSGLMLRLVARYLIERDYTIPSVSRNLYTEAFQSFAKALMVHYPELDQVTIVKHIVFASGSVIYYHGLGKLALQLSKGINEGTSQTGSKTGSESGNDAEQGGGDTKEEVGEIDREQTLEDVIDFAMYGFGGNTQRHNTQRHRR